SAPPQVTPRPAVVVQPLPLDARNANGVNQTPPAGQQPRFIPPPSVALPTPNPLVTTDGAAPISSDAVEPLLPATEPSVSAVPPPVMTLPRSVPGSQYLLVAEQLEDFEGELWQHRTWLNEEDGSLWESREDLGATNGLVGEQLVVDGTGLLWRTRLWSDPMSGSTWQTLEDLGASSQPYNAYPPPSLGSVEAVMPAGDTP
ncbi:MAG TPA: hypothetical protein VGQ62_22175, partial [Chloroflexota bacterium]|nr:hypothetical protein [Chloroflexota bacterium]